MFQHFHIYVQMDIQDLQQYNKKQHYSQISMCRECQCQCEQNCSEHGLTIAIDIQQPFECVCSPDFKKAGVETTDVIAGLLKYNSNLTKYLSKYQTNPTKHQPNQSPSLPEEEGNPLIRDTGKSIIDIYNLRVRPPQHQSPSEEDNGKQKNEENKRNNMIDFQQQTSPRNQQEMENKNKNRRPKPPKGSDQQKLQKHMKEVADSSRYLSNTGFKKYFGRECFENYGRENTNGVADGIIYNGYLKTFNISPHCGTNMPLTQQTNKHTLVKGDPNKYDGTKPIPETHYGNRVDRQAKQGYHNKPLANMPQIIEQSEQYHEDQQKYNINIKQPPRDQSERYMNTVYQVSKKLVPPPPPPFIPPSKHKGKQKQTQRQYQKITNQQSQKYIPKQNKQIYDDRTQQTKKTIDNYQAERREQSQIQTKYPKRDINEISNGRQVAKPKYEEWESEDDGDRQHRLRQKKNMIEECYYNMHLAHDIEKYQKPACSLCAQRRYTKCCCGA